MQRTGTPRIAWLLAAVAAGTLSAPPAASHERGPEGATVTGLETPPTTATHATVTGASARCASCHAAIADEWNASAHHRSASDPSYVAALAREPNARAFCRKCHAPGADPAIATPPAERAHGIGCVDCHAGMPQTHGTPTVSTSIPPAAVRACASCHEFTFPNGPTLMQKTATEHAASAFADSACASCHMPAIGGPRHVDHGFRVTPAMLSQALVADVARARGTRVAFRLKPGEVGHAFPTGDLFRRLVVRVDAMREGKAVASAERYLHRHFKSTTLPNGASTKVEVKDDRVGASLEPCFELDVGPGGRGLPLRIEIALEHVDQPRGPRERDAEVSAHVPVWTRTFEGGDEGSARPCR